MLQLDVNLNPDNPPSLNMETQEDESSSMADSRTESDGVNTQTLSLNSMSLDCSTAAEGEQSSSFFHRYPGSAAASSAAASDNSSRAVPDACNQCLNCISKGLFICTHKCGKCHLPLEVETEASVETAAPVEIYDRICASCSALMEVVEGEQNENVNLPSTSALWQRRSPRNPPVPVGGARPRPSYTRQFSVETSDNLAPLITPHLREISITAVSSAGPFPAPLVTPGGGHQTSSGGAAASGDPIFSPRLQSFPSIDQNENYSSRLTVPDYLGPSTSTGITAMNRNNRVSPKRPMPYSDGSPFKKRRGNVVKILEGHNFVMHNTSEIMQSLFGNSIPAEDSVVKSSKKDNNNDNEDNPEKVDSGLNSSKFSHDSVDSGDSFDLASGEYFLLLG